MVVVVVEVVVEVVLVVVGCVVSIALMTLLTVRMVTRQGLHEEARVITGLGFKLTNIIKIPF